MDANYEDVAVNCGECRKENCPDFAAKCRKAAI